jgi:cobalt-zinc-cadmium efflux system outer membrane protein
MQSPWAVMLAATTLFCGVAGAQAPRTLTLDTAFERVLEKHPDLVRLTHLRQSADATVEAESKRPSLRLDLELENAPRSKQDSSFDSAEATLSLASVLERGGKREARVAIADAQRNSLDVQGLQRRTDLLAEVARRYLDVLAFQSLEELATSEVAQREKAVEAAIHRVRAGATPESVRLAAEGALIRATSQRDRLRAQQSSAAARLAVLWNGRNPDFDHVGGDLLSMPAIPTLASLRELIGQSPELQRFAQESRLKEARLQLARSQRSADLEWRAGIRRLEEDGSWAAVVGVSIPLGSASRAEPAIRGAQAELAALTLERESEAMTLESTLLEAYSQLVAAQAEVTTGREQLLPKLEQAERSSERALRAGALTYAEWAQIQAEVTSARRDQLMAALDAHRALVEIQRLTGTSFNAAIESRRTQP